MDHVYCGSRKPPPLLLLKLNENDGGVGLLAFSVTRTVRHSRDNGISSQSDFGLWTNDPKYDAIGGCRIHCGG